MKNELTLLGWERIYSDKFIFMTKEADKDGYYTIAFSTCGSYDDEVYVTRDGFIGGVCCHNKFKKKNRKWAIPMLTADYYAHRRDFNNELIWARKAMKQNKNLTPEHFSKIIREKLK